MARINPFNFNLPAQPPEFVGRQSELSIFENFVQNTIDGAPKNYLINGPRGIGKSSLLEKCAEIAKKKGAFVRIFSTSSNPTGKIATTSELCRTILLEMYTEIETQSRLGIIKTTVAVEAKKAIEENLKRSGEFGKPKQVETPFFVDATTRIWQSLSKSFSCILIMIDEAERIETIPNGLDFLRETFIRIETLKAKYMLALSGKMTFPRKATELASPIMRFFHTETLGNLSELEMDEFIKIKTETSKITITDEAKKQLYLETKGHPYILVLYLYVLFQKLPEEKNTINSEHYNACKVEIHKFISKEFFDNLFYRSSRAGKEILIAIAKLNELDVELSSITGTLNKTPNRVSPYIGELVSTGILIRVEHGHYRLFHQLFLEYLKEGIELGILGIVPRRRKIVKMYGEKNRRLSDFG